MVSRGGVQEMKGQGEKSVGAAGVKMNEAKGRNTSAEHGNGRLFFVLFFFFFNDTATTEIYTG